MKISEFSKSQLEQLKTITHSYMDVLTDEAVEALTSKKNDEYSFLKKEIADYEAIYNRIELGLSIKAA